MKKSIARKQTIEKYLYILAKIHGAIKSGKNDLKFTNIMKHYKVSNAFKKALIDLNIIQNNTEMSAIQGTKYYYVWIDTAPDFKMAKKIVDYINSYHHKKKAEREEAKMWIEKVNSTSTNPFKEEPKVETPKEEPKPVVKKVKKDKVEVSLFWGLIKFNMNAK